MWANQRAVFSMLLALGIAALAAIPEPTRSLFLISAQPSFSCDTRFSNLTTRRVGNPGCVHGKLILLIRGVSVCIRQIRVAPKFNSALLRLIFALLLLLIVKRIADRLMMLGRMSLIASDATYILPVYCGCQCTNNSGNFTIIRHGSSSSAAN
jgi:hypothetical protein